MKPLLSTRLEIWKSAKDVVKYGIPWWMKLIWYIWNPKLYYKMKNLDYARGFYDPFNNKVMLCIDDIAWSSLDSIRAGHDRGVLIKYHTMFGLQFFYTLVHELLHQANVASDKIEGGHKIDHDKFEKLPECLKDIFDGLLQMEYSNDAFNNHPENRRKK